MGKGEIARFPQWFLSYWRTFSHFHQIQNCRLQTLSIWKSLNLLTLRHTNPRFNDPVGEKPFENIGGKVENAGNQQFLRFLQCCLTYKIQSPSVIE